MDPVVEWLLTQGWSGLGIIALGWAYLRERTERQEAQKRIEAALTAHSESRAAMVREVMTALGSMERAILSVSQRGGRADG